MDTTLTFAALLHLSLCRNSSPPDNYTIATQTHIHKDGIEELHVHAGAITQYGSTVYIEIAMGGPAL